VVDVDASGILNHLARERTDPAPSDDSAAFISGEPNRCG
jgi:hypothetical protein